MVFLLFTFYFPLDQGRYPSGQRGQTVNLLSYDFGGSNPSLPTLIMLSLNVQAEN